MSPRLFRHLVNLYPPFLAAAAHVEEIAPDWRYVRVSMPLRWYNRNYVGTHFGGNLFAMTDPFFMIMFMKNLGPDYIVWDKAGSIEFVAPGRGRVVAELRIDENDLAIAREATAAGDKYLQWFTVDVRGTERVVARVGKQLYVRRRATSNERRATGNGNV